MRDDFKQTQGTSSSVPCPPQGNFAAMDEWSDRQRHAGSLPSLGILGTVPRQPRQSPSVGRQTGERGAMDVALPVVGASETAPQTSDTAVGRTMSESSPGDVEASARGSMTATERQRNYRRRRAMRSVDLSGEVCDLLMEFCAWDVATINEALKRLLAQAIGYRRNGFEHMDPQPNLTPQLPRRTSCAEKP